jgi:hypothetical protein
MKSKEFIGGLATLVLLFSVICLTLVIMMDPSFGWFSRNLETDGNGAETVLQAEDAVADYYAYIYDVKDIAVHYTGEGRTDDEGESIDPTIENLDMQFHDTIFLQRNRYTPALIRIRLQDIRLDRRSGGTITLTLRRDTSIPEYTTENERMYLNEYLTSIMRFTLVQNDTWYNADAETIYTNADDALYTKIVTNENYAPAGSSEVFTTTTKDGHVLTSVSKEDAITLSVDYSAADAEDGELDLYLYVTYDGTLTENFRNTAEISTIISTVGQIVTMGNDLASMTICFE